MASKLILHLIFCHLKKFDIFLIQSHLSFNLVCRVKSNIHIKTPHLHNCGITMNNALLQHGHTQAFSRQDMPKQTPKATDNKQPNNPTSKQEAKRQTTLHNYAIWLWVCCLTVIPWIVPANLWRFIGWFWLFLSIGSYPFLVKLSAKSATKIIWTTGTTRRKIMNVINS